MNEATQADTARVWVAERGCVYEGGNAVAVFGSFETALAWLEDTHAATIVDRQQWCEAERQCYRERLPEMRAAYPDLGWPDEDDREPWVVFPIERNGDRAEFQSENEYWQVTPFVVDSRAALATAPTSPDEHPLPSETP